MLEKLKEDKLYAKLRKCEFWLKKVKFLGHVIQSEGMAANLSKIEAILNWQHFTSVLETQSLLGLVRYYKRYVEGLSKLLGPFTALSKIIPNLLAQRSVSKVS